MPSKGEKLVLLIGVFGVALPAFIGVAVSRRWEKTHEEDTRLQTRVENQLKSAKGSQVVICVFPTEVPEALFVINAYPRYKVDQVIETSRHVVLVTRIEGEE